MLVGRLQGEGYRPLYVREPGGTPVGEDIRQVILDNHYALSLGAELLLYMAARSELTGQLIIPALRSGGIVIADRFTDSTLAYQGYGSGADLKQIRVLNRIAGHGITPALTILLDLSAAAAALRRKALADRIESKDLLFHQRVRNGYLRLAAQEKARFLVIDAELSMEEIADQIWKASQALIRRTETV